MALIYQRVCLFCGNPFETNHRLKVYCTEKCGDRYRQVKHYKNNPEYYKAKREDRRLYHLERGILSRIKHRAKKNNIPFNLELEDIIIPEICPVLNIEIKIQHGHSGYFPNSPSVDRIKPKLGYTKDNIRIISNRANLLKSDASSKEMELVLKDLKEIENASF